VKGGKVIVQGDQMRGGDWKDGGVKQGMGMTKCKVDFLESVELMKRGPWEKERF